MSVKKWPRVIEWRHAVNYIDKHDLSLVGLKTLGTLIIFIFVSNNLNLEGVGYPLRFLDNMRSWRPT